MTQRPSLLGDMLARISLGWSSGRGAPIGERCEALLAGSGEATGLAVARDILGLYAALDAGGRLAFFQDLATRFGVDDQALAAALERREAGGALDAREVHRAAEPRSQELIRRLNRAAGGARALVDMRADLIGLLHEAPDLAGLDEDFRHLFSSWFNRGFLRLETVDWDSPASMLEKIIRYEAVHAIAGWDDLRGRVASPDRRLYAFFHPALPGEPLIFVEVALMADVPDAIAPILAPERTPIAPGAAKTAVFYSISNTQPGLRGVSFGNFLIKQVVEDLRTELPGLKTFVTLSPAPMFRAWATAEADKGANGRLAPAERDTVFALETGGSPERERIAEVAARYYLEAGGARGPVDPVARFHLGNGARLERINPAADPSENGQANAWGLMVNYLYDLATIERNHEAFAAHRTVAASAAVTRLARKRKEENA